jgi:hypothetical protein
MDPFALFNPAAYNPLDPQSMLAAIEPQRLLDTAAVFPGGALVLVFALFFAPVGPGIPAGVLLARHAGINPLMTLGLYALTDLIGAFICHPWYVFLKRLAARVPVLRAIGNKLLKFALIGARPPRVEDLQQGGKGALPALFRIGTIGFGLDVYHAGMVVAGLPIPRVAGWLAAIAGDLVWFSVLLVTSLLTATVTQDDRINAVVMVVVMIALPPLAKRYIPALRDPAPAPATPVSVLIEPQPALAAELVPTLVTPAVQTTRDPSPPRARRHQARSRGRRR